VNAMATANVDANANVIVESKGMRNGS
jgi:hypothetical protein